MVWRKLLTTYFPQRLINILILIDSDKFMDF